MIKGQVNKGKVEVKIEGSVIDLLTELQLLNLHVMVAISEKLNVPLNQVIELSFGALLESVCKEEQFNVKPNN